MNCFRKSMNYIRCLLLLGVCPAAVHAALFQDINLQSSEHDTLRDNTDVNLTSSFTFQLGSFKDGFAPTATNLTQWLDNWVVFHVADFNVVQESGQPDAPVFAFNDAGMTLDGTSVFSHSSNDGYDFSDQRAWLWVFNDSQVTPSTTTEWFLGSATVWEFPDKANFDDEEAVSPFEVNWSLLDFQTSDVPIWGGQNGQEGAGYKEVFSPSATLQTYKVIPEPGTWILMGIAGGAVLLGTRMRRRKGARQ